MKKIEITRGFKSQEEEETALRLLRNRFTWLEITFNSETSKLIFTHTDSNRMAVRRDCLHYYIDGIMSAFSII